MSTHGTHIEDLEGQVGQDEASTMPTVIEDFPTRTELDEDVTMGNPNASD
jgi:hypothetical protein